MGEPLSIISSVAGIIGLADVALRGGKGLYDFFSALKDAPLHVKSLSTELKHLNDILSEIQGFSSDYCQAEFVVKDGLKLKGYLTALMQTQDQVAVLSKTIKPMEPDASQGKIKQLKYQLQWTLMKDQLERLYQDLGRHKLTLLATLSLCGRRSDLHIHRKQRAIERSLYNHQTSTLRHYQALSTAVQQANLVSLEALGAIRGLRMTQAQGFEAVQASLSAQTGTKLVYPELIRQDNSTIQKQISKVEDSIGVGFAMANQKIENMVAGIARESSGKKEQNDWDAHVINIDVESLTLSILLMKDTFRDALYMVCPDDEQGYLAVHVIWSDFNSLLASSLEASASLAKIRSRVPFVRSRTSLPTLEESAASHDYSSGVLSDERSVPNNANSEFSSPRLVPKRFKRTRSTRHHLRMTPDGLLWIEMNCGTTDDSGKMNSTRVTFLPTITSCRVGFVAHFTASLEDMTCTVSHRQLCIVNIIPHKDGHPGAWEIVPKNEIRALQRPLCRDIDSPFDDLDDDTTILWVCPKKFWRRLQRMNRQCAGSQFVQKSRDIITARCGSDVLSMVCGGRGAGETVPSPITPEAIFPVASDLCFENLPPPITPEAILPDPSDPYIEHESTRLLNTKDTPTRPSLLEDKPYNLAEYANGASNVQSIISLLSAAEQYNSKPDEIRRRMRRVCSPRGLRGGKRGREGLR